MERPKDCRRLSFCRVWQAEMEKRSGGWVATGLALLLSPASGGAAVKMGGVDGSVGVLLEIWFDL